MRIVTQIEIYVHLCMHIYNTLYNPTYSVLKSYPSLSALHLVVSNPSPPSTPKQPPRRDCASWWVKRHPNWSVKTDAGMESNI